jgi:hypothetical protein
LWVAHSAQYGKAKAQAEKMSLVAALKRCAAQKQSFQQAVEPRGFQRISGTELLRVLLGL